MCFNHSKKLIFLGSVESFSSSASQSHESLVPTIYALECNGYLLSTLDKIQIGGVESSQGIFTIHAHHSEDVVFCTFNTHVVFASLLHGQFHRCKTVEKFSESAVYRSSLQATSFFGYCPRSESLKVLLFEEKPHAKVGWLEQSVGETSDLPVQKYYYTIKEFDNDIRFILVAEEVGLLFVFRSVVHRCAITRNSLTLEDQVAYLGSRC